MKLLALIIFLLFAAAGKVMAHLAPVSGTASWYGEEHRGRLMANGRKFNPDKLTAASWYYPLGSRVQVICNTPGRATRSVVVTITDRGPAKDLVQNGRIIDLTRAAFRRLSEPNAGLVQVVVRRVR